MADGRVSVDVYDGPRCLTDDESFDADPTDEQIALLIATATPPLLDRSPAWGTDSAV
ncbi:hypothetical protein [Actinocatenispora rupis]|uniref:Uncharacterized protein n=1 Tax=Actinocatenispora rupis TaxID=519421 RepID=A0A8J3JDT6_9ACTN|nr:hypothetical protein [Actinocatenispora rupis]GID14874.1 hypothetical protein Aru02nite_57630 [Actinocatenispora rupis]